MLVHLLMLHGLPKICVILWAGLKMSDIGGRDPLRNMRSFLTDEDSWRDLQSHHNVFLMKINLPKETKESYKKFEDIFQFFKLSGLSKEEKQGQEKNHNKFKWEHLNDLQPLSVTFTTDMAACWHWRWREKHRDVL
jgi:hypothetical protein